MAQSTGYAKINGQAMNLRLETMEIIQKKSTYGNDLEKSNKSQLLKTT